MNEYTFEGNKCYILATNKTHGNMKFLIDSEDFNRVKMFKWKVHIKKGNKPYCTAYLRSRGVSHNILLHRLITSFDWEIVDHIDGDTSNNLKNNLRDGSNGVNGRNRFKTSGKELPVGVFKSNSRFRASITRFGVKKDLGTFSTVNEAEQAYLKARNASS